MKHRASILFLALGLGVASAQTAPALPRPKTKGEVLAFIKKTGGTPPDWFAATPLNYPKTLDLSWSPPPQGSPWDPNKNVGQFLWTSINENETRWKEGVRFLHHMLTVNKDKPATLKQVMGALGNRNGVLPFSVTVDGAGRLRQRRVGAYSAEELRSDLAALLR